MRVLLALPAVAVLVLTGCAGFGGGGNAPQNYAEYFCEQQVAATFDDPESAEFSLSEGGPDGVDRYSFTIDVTADGQEFSLDCVVTGTEGAFLLESYELTAK